MLIKTRLRLIALLPGIVILVIGAGLWMSWQQVDGNREIAALARDARNTLAEENALMQEYLLYGGLRIESQLNAVRGSMNTRLAALEMTGTIDRELLDDLRQANREIDELSPLLQKGSGEARNLLAGAMGVKLQYMLLKARQLEDQQNEQVVQIQRQGETVIVALLVLMGFAIVALLWLLGRRVTRVIDELATGMTLVKAGYRDRKVRVSEEDELGALARSFNEMTDKLNAAEVSLKEKIASLSQRTTQLEATYADLESFSYSVSHDLRAPLRAIDGYCAIITKDYAGQLDDEGRRLFGIVRENAMRMGQLIEDILAFSRAGRRELKADALDMDTLTQEVWLGLEPQRTGRNVEFRCADLPATLGDPVAIRQALQNLLSNALKFSGGREPAVIEVAGRREKAENVYCVRDNGVGFDMAYADKLFVLFQRLHSMVEFEGTGVGLAIVKRVIAKHGGRVWAQGKLGEGATFWFTLPTVQADDKGKESASGSS